MRARENISTRAQTRDFKSVLYHNLTQGCWLMKYYVENEYLQLSLKVFPKLDSLALIGLELSETHINRSRQISVS